MQPFTRAYLADRYGYLETLSPDGLVWELQRRSDAYRAEHEAATAITKEPTPEVPPARVARWRLWFLRKP